MIRFEPIVRISEALWRVDRLPLVEMADTQCQLPCTPRGARCDSVRCLTCRQWRQHRREVVYPRGVPINTGVVAA